VDTSFSKRWNQLIQGTLFLFWGEALGFPVALVIVAFLARTLGPENYGMFILTATVITWIKWSIVSVFSRATVKLIGEAEEWRAVAVTIVRAHFFISLGVAVLSFFLAGPIGLLLKETDVTDYLRLFVLDIPLFSLVHAYQNILTGCGRFQERALSSTAYLLAKLILIVLFVGLGFSISGAILGNIGASLVGLMVIHLFFVPFLLFEKPGFPLRKLAAHSIPQFLFAISMRFFSSMDLLALKILGMGIAQVGFYGAAKNLSQGTGIFSLSFSPVLISNLSAALRTGDRELAKKMARQAMRLVIALLPFAALAAGAANEITGFVFGTQFLMSGPFFALLIWGATALIMISVTTGILTVADKPVWAFAVAGPLFLLALGGYLVFIPRFGAIGAAMVTTTLAVIGALASVLSVYRIWGILPPAGTFLRCGIISILVYFLASAWNTTGLLLLVKMAALGTIILIFFLVSREMRAKEIAFLRSMFWPSMPNRATNND
jgi:O-antigen/teichoic acid export membrane protein